MSIWGAVGKILNSNFKKPLNEQIQDYVFANANLFTSNATFIVPQTGIYKIICVGAGGTSIYSYSTYNCNSASGGGGGVGIKKIRLIVGTTYNITIGTTASISGTNVSITATAGANGGGSGGTSSGGDYNYTGQTGIAQTDTQSRINGVGVGVMLPNMMERFNIGLTYYYSSTLYFEQVMSGLGILGFGYSGGVCGRYFSVGNVVGNAQQSGGACVIIQLVQGE